MMAERALLPLTLRSLSHLSPLSVSIPQPAYHAPRSTCGELKLSFSCVDRTYNVILYVLITPSQRVRDFLLTVEFEKRINGSQD